MKTLLLIAALALAGCVAPAAAAPVSSAPVADCSITAATPHDSPGGRQLTVDGQGFLNSELVVLTLDIPGRTTTDVQVQATASGNFETEITAGPDGRYSIGPARGLVCVAPTVFVVLTTVAPTPQPTARPTARPTVPPTPTITLPPTDTE